MKHNMKKANDQIRFAVIGLGWVANNRHIPCILRHPRANLIGVVDHKEEKVIRIKEKFNRFKNHGK